MIALLLPLVGSQIDPAHKQTLVLYHETQPEFQSLGLKNQDTGTPVTPSSHARTPLPPRAHSLTLAPPLARSPPPPNTHTGDLFGDLYFVLRSVSLPIECASSSPLARFDCANPEQNNTATNVISQNTVDVDGRWGDYGACNVNETSKTYACACRSSNASSHVSVPCNASVGRSTIYDRESPPAGGVGHGEDWQWWRVNLARKMGGSAAGGAWFSTTSSGECSGSPTAAPAAPAAGGRAGAAAAAAAVQQHQQPCHWSLTATTRTIASSCLLTRVGDAVVAHSPACFDGCGAQAANQSSACYVGCFMGSVLGPAGGRQLINETDGIPLAVVSGAWGDAFAPPASGGCPDQAQQERKVGRGAQ